MFSYEIITICGRSFVHNLMLQRPTYAGSLQWRHNGLTGVSIHQLHDCLLNRLLRRRPKKTPKLRVTGLCAGKSPVTGEFPAQMASNAENVSIWWRFHVVIKPWQTSVSGTRGYLKYWRFTIMSSRMFSVCFVLILMNITKGSQYPEGC